MHNSSHRGAVLISGASSGIGYSSALMLQQRGYRVFAGARRDEDLQRLRALGLEAVALDLCDSAQIHAAAEQVLDATGGCLYGLFNNAGYGQPGAVEDLSRAALREQFETNLFGTMELTCALLPAMRARGRGRIIQNSSVLGFAAMPYRGAYNASKFALEGITDTLRLELRGSGIYVSLIEPGPIRSRFRENSLAAFQRHIEPAGSAHEAAYERVLARLASRTNNNRFALDADAVGRCLIQALEATRPKIRYRVTTPTKAIAVLKRLLPARALDRLLGDVKE
ncbi:SDR family NAD(P)-dependent oxidoreductase [Granulosicoccaceae sp. 1_MG-2023]|nr:SDR family NAD(P)-dependent oxidoreductase [Granulosicoccaceae sp. 1_MG-2023]